MGQLQQVLTYENKVFSAIQIPGKRQDGFNKTPSLYQNEAKDNILLVDENLNVLAVLKSSDTIEISI